ncbi:biotin synthase [Inhella gelatinilytica]|uniref:Biotin synthase n=1 Tax=Inhella gelatinilytica TaxID=2795030 RepID=A0A931NDK6_9BURK|nr:biotin synthase [Inhella gelatinilytica]MBH9553172.1 biotin synthase [Inhella gelatinilytica]
MTLLPPDPNAVQRQRRRLEGRGEVPWLMQALSARMAERLPLIKLEARSIVLWHSRVGGGSEAVRARYPEAQLVWVEEGAAALAARQQVARPWWQPWRTVNDCVCEPSELKAGLSDMVWANLGVLGVNDPQAVFARWSYALAPQGYVLFSSLGPDSFLELRSLYAAHGWGAATPAWMDLHDLGDALLQAGFADPVMDQERLTLTWGCAEDLWRDLQALGGNVAPDRFVGCRTPGWRARWLAAAESHLRGPDGRLRLTLEFVCGHAIRAEPRSTGESTVPLSDLQAQLRRRRAPY